VSAGWGAAEPLLRPRGEYNRTGPVCARRTVTPQRCGARSRLLRRTPPRLRLPRAVDAQGGWVCTAWVLPGVEAPPPLSPHKCLRRLLRDGGRRRVPAALSIVIRHHAWCGPVVVVGAGVSGPPMARPPRVCESAPFQLLARARERALQR